MRLIAASALPWYDVLWTSALGTIVAGAIGGLAAWLAHRRGWLAKPAGAIAGWLRKEGGTISQDVVKVIVDELERRGATARKAPAKTTAAKTTAPKT